MAKILIAEDEQELRGLYKEILTNAHFEVDAVSDGQEALEKIRTGSYDVVLLDVMMPLLDGLGVLTKLTQEEPKPARMPAIIMWSNLSHEPAVAQAMQMGAKSYLVKANITPDQLIREITKVLSPQNSAPAPTLVPAPNAPAAQPANQPNQAAPNTPTPTPTPQQPQQ